MCSLKHYSFWRQAHIICKWILVYSSCTGEFAFAKHLPLTHSSYHLIHYVFYISIYLCTFQLLVDGTKMTHFWSQKHNFFLEWHNYNYVWVCVYLCTWLNLNWQESSERMHVQTNLHPASIKESQAFWAPEYLQTAHWQALPLLWPW